MINIEENFEFKLNDIIVVGCSSGPDSMALVDMLLKIREKYNLFLIIAHVNHNVRKESFEEAKFIEKYCEENHEITKSRVFAIPLYIYYNNTYKDKMQGFFILNILYKYYVSLNGVFF